MTSGSVPMSQKEYLKKYLSGSDGAKKKKKKKTTLSTLKRSQIIDDDIDLKNMRALNDDEVDIYQMDEDAPQVAGIIDERPAEVKSQEYYNDSKRWKVFADDASDSIKVVDQQKNNSVSNTKNSENTYSTESKKETSYKKNQEKGNFDNKQEIKERKQLVSNYGNDSDSDQSLPRQPSKNNNSKSRRDGNDSDQSLPRRTSKNNASRSRRDGNDSDQSLPRQTSKNNASRSRRDGNDSDQSLRRQSSKSNHSRYRRDDNDSDQSFPRQSSKSNHSRSRRDDNDLGQSLPRQSSRSNRSRFKQDDNDSDQSLPRQLSKNNESRSRWDGSDSDLSPPRKSNASNRSSKINDLKNYEKRKYSDKAKSDSDLSLPRTSKMEYKKDSKNSKYSSNSKDNSSRNYSNRIRRNKSTDNDSDLSPVRKSSSDRKHSSKSRRKNESESDVSPPRKTYSENRGGASKIPRTDQKSSRWDQSDSDLSPYKKTLRTEDKRDDKHQRGKQRDKRSSSRSPRNTKPLSKQHEYHKKYSRSPSRKTRQKECSRANSDSDLSPPQKSLNSKNTEYEQKKRNTESDSPDSKIKKSKMEKTLDGKKAGLQDAKNLKKELTDFKNKEDQLFSKMNASVSGQGAAPIVRDRKTGKIRDLDEEKVIDKEKAAKDDVRKEKYSRWGKGLKQVEDAAERLADAMKEMNKPLARYADDEDLDKFLKAQEREGDPMLDYIKRKQDEAVALSGHKPQYQGSFTPNRFGIRPGHRWDGVDRSNGFEKKWFTQQNARKARDEEAYKWSTSDM